jgi:cell filamentation protein
MNEDDPYLYPGSTVLINKLGITQPDKLAYAERELAAQRQAEGVPEGGFDLAHLRAIHFHLFQDIYAWAGALRTVEMAKSGHQFQFRRFIETGMRDIHRRLVGANFLRALSPEQFASSAAHIIGDVNYVHPFRDGNGRTQLLFLEQLASQAGHCFDLTRLDPARWIDASRAAHLADYSLVADEIRCCIAGQARIQSAPGP